MDAADLSISIYRPELEQQVIALWEACALTRPWNDPAKDIRRKQAVNAELFLVGLMDGRVVASVMGGYEGHRGWISYLGVHPDYQRRGYGRRIMDTVTEKLRALGCPKINLQVRDGNENARKFYESIGYKPDPVFSMGKRLVEDG